MGSTLTGPTTQTATPSTSGANLSLALACKRPISPVMTLNSSDFTGVVVTAATPTVDLGDELDAVAGSCKDITTLEQLKQVTTCGLTAQAVKSAVTAISIVNQGPQLSYWPPAVCQFSHLTSINLSGNALTFIPQSVQDLQGLQQLLVSTNNLGSLPPEIGALTALTELDVGGNSISKLPDALCKLTGLKVLNAWGNQLTALPEGFGSLTSLVRLGLKGNQLTALPDSFTGLTNLVELFLTDNNLTTLPQGFGKLRSLVKLQASYNPFEYLPDDLWQLPNLELFRLAVGELKQWPAGTGGLPRLAWCSLGSNPAAAGVPALPDLPHVRVSDLAMGSKLGQGASGEVFICVYNGEAVAVKIFLPGASPDGSTCEEIAITCNNSHNNLTKVIAVVVEDDHTIGRSGSNGGRCGSSSDYDGVKGLVMVLVKGKPMADRPTSQHLLRCKWPADHTYSSNQVVGICSGLASALSYLHSKGVCHGDMYAHNIMLEGESHAVLCDFGAAFCYDRTAAAGCWEAMEVRAFGLFMHGLIQQISDGSSNGSSGGSAGVRNSGSNRQGASGAVQQLHALVEACLADDPAARPTFADLQKQLEGLQL